MPDIGNPLSLNSESVEPTGESTTNPLIKQYIISSGFLKNMLHAII